MSREVKIYKGFYEILGKKVFIARNKKCLTLDMLADLISVSRGTRRF